MIHVNITLPKLHAAYESWLGRPVKVLTFRKHSSRENIPTELDVLFFQPSRPSVEEKHFAYIATAGMSKCAMKGPFQRVELILRVDKTQTLQDLETLGRGLAELAVLPFREDSFLTPDLLLYNVHPPLFDDMTCALVTNWIITSPKWLRDLEPPVLVLSVHPVFEREAGIIRQIGSLETCRRFIKEGINWYDPKRSVGVLLQGDTTS